MNENFSEFDARFKQADPAADAPKIAEHVLNRATNAKPRKSARFRLLATLSTATTGLAATVAVALAVSSPVQPLFEMGANGTSATGMEDSKLAGSSALMPMWWVQYEFVAGPDLSNSESGGQVYQLVASPQMSENMISLASYFGIEGSPVSQAGYETDFSIGGNSKGEYQSGKPMLWYSTTTGSWSYNDDSIWGTVTCDANKVCTQAEPDKTSWVPMPTKDAAIAKAKEVFAAACSNNSSDFRFEFMGDTSWAAVNAYLQVEGVDTVGYTISWAQSGMLAGAYGSCVDVKSKGYFSTVSPAKAVERLNDYRWGVGLPASYYAEKSFYGNGLRMGVDDMMVGTLTTEGQSSESGSGEASAVDPAQPAEPSAVPAEEPTLAPDGTVTAEPLPVVTDQPEPMPTPTIQQVAIVKAKQTLATVWDAKGTMWLVPAWVLYADEGMVSGVIALHDGVIKLPEAMPMVK